MTSLTQEVRTNVGLATSESDDPRTAGPPKAVDDATGQAGLLQLLHERQTQVATLTEALGSNRRIGMAVGIVMKHLVVTDEAAFEALRAVSMNSNRKLRDVAEDVIRDRALRTPPG